MKGNEKRIGRFDVMAFHAGLDAERKARGITLLDAIVNAVYAQVKNKETD